SGPGFLPPVWVLGLFLTLDLLTTNLVEPRVCGRSVGLAPVPLLLAVTFWTGLWGVVGLVLATPVTVCLAVLGKPVPQLPLPAARVAAGAAEAGGVAAAGGPVLPAAARPRPVRGGSGGKGVPRRPPGPCVVRPGPGPGAGARPAGAEGGRAAARGRGVHSPLD